MPVPVPALTSRELAAAQLGRPWTVAEVVKDLRRPTLTELGREVAHRRLAMAILSTLHGIDFSTSSLAFRRAWEKATAGTKPKAKRSPKLAVWTPQQLRDRAAGFLVLPGSYRP